MMMQTVTIRRCINNVGEHVTICSQKGCEFKTLAAVFSLADPEKFYGCSYQKDGTCIDSKDGQSFDEFVKAVFKV